MTKQSVKAEEEGSEISVQRTEVVRRFLHTKLLFWKACGEKACRRARACRGDVDECWRLWRSEIPDEFMMKLRVGISARAEGASAKEAVRAANAHVAALNAVLARHHVQPGTQTHRTYVPADASSSPKRTCVKPPRVRVM